MRRRICAPCSTPLLVRADFQLISMPEISLNTEPLCKFMVGAVLE